MCDFEFVTVGHSVYRSNSEDASITFRNIKVQAFEVNGMNFSTGKFCVLHCEILSV